MATPTFRYTNVRNTLITAAIAVSVGFTVSACNKSPMSPKGSDSLSTGLDDIAITTKVKSGFVGDPSLKNSDISVATTNGVVTLTGSAAGSTAKSTAEGIAKRVEGVKSVDDELTMSASAGTDTTSINRLSTDVKGDVTDGWITTKVKSEILADSMTKGFKVGVNTTDGVVTLDGTLPSQQAIDHVKALTEGVKGVKSVNIRALSVASR